MEEDVPSKETMHDHDNSVVRKLLDSPFWLLLISLLIVFASYTIWGIYELSNVPIGKLPQ